MKKLTSMAVVLTLLLIGAIAPVSADNGDGNVACNYGEICMRDYHNSTKIKHYWYNAVYDNNHKWYNTATGIYVAFVKDDISEIRNKDSVCDVDLIVVQAGAEPFFRVPNNGATYGVPSNVNQKADMHVRCV